MAAKRSYDINGRTFEVRKDGDMWSGWFADDPHHVIRDVLKRQVLQAAGYESQTAGIVFTTSDVYSAANPRMESPSIGESFDRIRMRIATGHFPELNLDEPIDRFVILARDLFTCTYCSEPINSFEHAHVDHIRPVTKGGHDTAGNLVTACLRCNIRKSNNCLPNEEAVLTIALKRNQERGIPNDQLVTTGHLCICNVDRCFGCTDYSWRLQGAEWLDAVNAMDDPLGRLTTHITVANNVDIICASDKASIRCGVPHQHVDAAIVLGSGRLAVPFELVESLGLIQTGECRVFYSGNRGAVRPLVSNVWLQLCGREGVFSAIVEPKGPVIVGGNVLEELDLIVNCDPSHIRAREEYGVIVQVN